MLCKKWSVKNYLLKISAVQGVGVEAGGSGLQSQPLLLETMFQKTKRNKARKTLIPTIKLKPTSSDGWQEGASVCTSSRIISWGDVCVPNKDVHEMRVLAVAHCRDLGSDISGGKRSWCWGVAMAGCSWPQNSDVPAQRTAGDPQQLNTQFSWWGID